MNLKKIFIVLLLILVTTGCDFSLGEDPSDSSGSGSSDSSDDSASGSSSSLIPNDFSSGVTAPVNLPEE